MLWIVEKICTLNFQYNYNKNTIWVFPCKTTPKKYFVLKQKIDLCTFLNNVFSKTKFTSRIAI